MANQHTDKEARDERREKVSKLRDKGLSIRDIAKHTGIPTKTVHRDIAALDRSVNKAPRNVALRRQWVKKLRDRGLTYKEIAGELFVSDSVVAEDLRRLAAIEFWQEREDQGSYEVPQISKHPDGKCRQANCEYCFPEAGKARVHAEIVVTIDMAALTQDMGISDYGTKDAKFWFQEDIAKLVSSLPYSSYISNVGVAVKGLRDPR